MKFSALISVLFLCFVFVACATDDDNTSCVTAFDCPDGYSCIDSVCRAPSAETDADQNGDDGSQDMTESPDSGNSEGPEPGEFETPIIGGDDDPDNHGDINGCPNDCSGFGECNFETEECVCIDNHAGKDCSECAEGYHWEAEGDDEDGDGVVSCAVNLTCNPNPCHGNGCREEGNTVKCTCAAANHQDGRWCEKCADGYMLNNAGVCKEDCSLKTCTPPQKCGIDYASNEASCNACENEYYTGTDCKSCDPVHFCNGHATACVVEGGTEKCTCEAAYTGSTCNTCASGYFQSNGVCIKNCDANKCFKTHQCTGTSALGFEITASVSGHGTCNSTTGECMCDAGWLTADSGGETVNCGIVTVLETLNNVECTVCDKNNPPSQYATNGCPADCPMLFCNNAILMEDTSLGGCYYEPTGSHRLYCKCNSGYTIQGGNIYYENNPTGMCESESGE